MSLRRASPSSLPRLLSRRWQRRIPLTRVISSAPEYAGMVGNVALFIGVGIGAVSALFLPIICGTLNPVQMAINLGIVEGEVSNLRKFKRNGEPMEHGTKFGHTQVQHRCLLQRKYIDFAGTQKTVAQQEK